MELMKRKNIALLLAISTISGLATPTLLSLKELNSYAYENEYNLTEKEKQIYGIKKIVTSGGNYTMFIKEDGTVWGTGYNNYGQLGIGNTTNQKTPVKVNITDVKDIICSYYYTVFLKNDGTVWACGWNGSGQLGVGNTTNQNTPVKINISNVKKIALAYQHTFFIKENGELWGCGGNSFGQLGTGNTTQQTTPIKLNITDVKDVVGGDYSIILKNDGTVWGCGANQVGQLGIGNTSHQSTPVKINVGEVDRISCGGNTVFFMLKDGTVWGTGYNYYGQLGIGNDSTQTNPVKLSITNVNNISCSSLYSIFLKNDGTVWSCGYNSSGQLGIGNTTNKTTPTKVNITNVNKVMAGGSHTFFIKDDGTMWGCGNNSSGQLCIDNNTNNQLSPVQLNIAYVYSAEDFVLKAESSKSQADLDIAKEKVDNMNDSQEKTVLLDKINEIQTEINIKNATDLLEKLEEDKNRDSITIVQNAINKINDTTIKKQLQDRLNIVKNELNISDNNSYNKLLQNAIDKLDKAEISKNNIDITIAQTTINSLNESDKALLQERLNELKEQIKIEQDELNYSKLLQDAKDKLTKAESTKKDYDISISQIAIDKLKPEDKAILQEQLNNLKEQIKLEKEVLDYAKLLEDTEIKVTKAETSKKDYDITVAQTSITKLKIDDRQQFQNRIDNLVYNILLEDANIKVINAEELRTDTSINIAQIAVNKVPHKEVETFSLEETDLLGKPILQSKLDSLKLSIEEERYLKLLEDAETKVTNAESTKTLKDITLAQLAIDRLKEINKTELQERLDALTQRLKDEEKEKNALKLATLKVEQAEKLNNQKYINEAKELVQALKPSDEKEALLERLTALETSSSKTDEKTKTLIYQAEVYVKQAEALKRESYVIKAQAGIDKIPEGNQEKILLQTRLNSVKVRK